MRKLKQLEPYLEFTKYTKNIPLCCHMFFEYVNNTIRATIPEYQEVMVHDKINGILLCPTCLVNKVETKRIKN